MTGRVRAEKCLRFWVVLLWAAASTACVTAGLERSIWEGDYDAVERAVSEGGGVVNQQLDNFQTPLHVAAASGNLPMVRLLVENGADVHARSPDGSTPLHRAAYTEHIEVVRLLVERESDVNARDRIGDTPLHNAVLQDGLEVVEFLVASGADASAANDAGKTLADLAFVRALRPARAFLLAHMAEERSQVPPPGGEARPSPDAASQAAPRVEPADEPRLKWKGGNDRTSPGTRPRAGTPWIAPPSISVRTTPL